MEHGDWLRALLAETRTKACNAREWEREGLKVRCRWLCDARSVVDHVKKDVGTPNDKRLAIELAALRQLTKRSGKDELIWIDTTVMPADVLTKDMPCDLLWK